MPHVKRHSRQYDLVVLGASGYTGKYTAEHIATHLPTSLRWAVAGRSREKLEAVVATCKTLDRDRRPPDIRVCELENEDLVRLAKETFILITTVGPYGRLGEHAFRACAENGTHYLDVTGEVPFVARMIASYESAARRSGAVMFPQIGIESAPADLVTWSVVKLLKDRLSAATQDVTVSIHDLSGAPSGGTLATVLTMSENFSAQEMKVFGRPFALSPKPYLEPLPTTSTSLLARLTGLVHHPALGLLTTSPAGAADAVIVGRTWGLLNASYGPRFSFREHMRTRNRLTGIVVHLATLLLGLVLLSPPLCWALKPLVLQPGQGPDPEAAKKERIEYRAAANPDVAGMPKQQALCRAWYRGSMYALTGLLLAQAAATILEADLELEGGIYTPACLGQNFIDNCHRAGFRFETELVTV